MEFRLFAAFFPAGLIHDEGLKRKVYPWDPVWDNGDIYELG